MHFFQFICLMCKLQGLFQGLANEIQALACDFIRNCQYVPGTKKSQILPNEGVGKKFKLAPYFSNLSKY